MQSIMLLLSVAQNNQLPALTLFIAAATNNVFTLNGDGKQKQAFMQECVIEGHLIAIVFPCCSVLVCQSSRCLFIPTGKVRI